MNISSDSIESIYNSLNSSIAGLSSEVAKQRLVELHKAEKKETRFKREFKLLVRQFTNPLILLLVVAVILSAVLGENSDTLIILFILVSTGLMSFFQEQQAGRAVEKLQQIIKLKCLVIRDGKEESINTEAASFKK